jgi:hypothetical protein
LLFRGGPKLVLPHLQRWSSSLAPFRIITDWLFVSPSTKRV